MISMILYFLQTNAKFFSIDVFAFIRFKEVVLIIMLCVNLFFHIN